MWDYLFTKKEYFVVILGLDNAGKTVSLCVCLCVCLLLVSKVVYEGDGNCIITDVSRDCQAHLRQKLSWDAAG